MPITKTRTAALVALMALAAPGATSAEDFTFRRVRVADMGSGPRVLVQIDPAEQARRLAALAPVTEWTEPENPVLPATATPGPTPANAGYAWFWETVPTGLGPVADRFPSAIARLSQGPEGKSVRAPRMQDMQEIVVDHGATILTATAGTDVSPALVLAVIGIESAGRRDAVSHAGAQGLMQLIPATADRFGVTDAMDPAQNIRGGVAYLDWLMAEFDRDPLMVLAAYNAGEGAVRQNGGVPPYAETRDYVPKVLAAWQVAQGLCLTPPELVSDPCVFRIMAQTAGVTGG